MAQADSKFIQWLLHESGISRYQIGKDCNISQSHLSRVANSDKQLNRLNFDLAVRLTMYAKEKLQQQNQENSSLRSFIDERDEQMLHKEKGELHE